MDLRRSLKDDFQIEVLLEGGSGVRDDPFVIEPCTAAEATRTQLNLLRGLGLGRRELWRLVQAGSADDVGPSIQRLRIETAAFTPDQIITGTRAYYFDIRHVSGVPNASVPFIEWADQRTTFSAVSQIGWLHFDKATDNSRDPRRLDTSLFYSGQGAKATIYVYDAADRSVLAGVPPAEARATELQDACEQVYSVHANAETPWPVRVVEPFLLQHFIIGENMSIAGVAPLDGHFVKFRLTYFDDLQMRALMNDTICDLCRFVSQGVLH